MIDESTPKPPEDILLFLAQQSHDKVLELDHKLTAHVFDETISYKRIIELLERNGVLTQVNAAHLTKQDLQNQVVHHMPQYVSRLWSILNQSQEPTKLISLTMYLLAAMGFLLYSPASFSGDLTYLVLMGGQKLWAGLFLVMAFGRMVDLFWWKGNRLLNMLGPIMGTWLWAMLFISSSVMTPLDGVSELHLSPILIEVWILYRAFFEWRGKPWTL